MLDRTAGRRDSKMQCSRKNMGYGYGSSPSSAVSLFYDFKQRLCFVSLVLGLLLGNVRIHICSS